jgi:Rod binding domain-containing protein
MADSLINAVSSPTGLDAAPTITSKDSPEKIREAASQFEALLISQVLKSAHEGEDGGWMGAGEEDETSNTTMGMADEYFARSIAAHGGFGLAKMISAGLSRKSGGAPEPVAAGAAKASD